MDEFFIVIGKLTVIVIGAMVFCRILVGFFRWLAGPTRAERERDDLAHQTDAKHRRVIAELLRGEEVENELRRVDKETYERSQELFRERLRKGQNR